MIRSALHQRVRQFIRDQNGAVVVDFVPVFFGMVVIILVIFEIGIAYFLSLRSLKAAQIGARVAAVMPAIHSGVPLTNERPAPLVAGEPTGADGEPCFNPSGADRCVDPGGPWICDGGSFDASVCDPVAFGMLVRDMRRTFSNLDPAAVTVTYAYRRLGETGGQFIPEVNVTIAAHDYTFAIFSLGDYCRQNGQNCSSDGADLDGKNRTRFGSVSASAYGENTAGLAQPVPASEEDPTTSSPQS
ncbi:MAG: hypothetical protein AAF674_09435 [Pseudomonadota bacterium]